MAASAACVETPPGADQSRVLLARRRPGLRAADECLTSTEDGKDMLAARIAPEASAGLLRVDRMDVEARPPSQGPPLEGVLSAENGRDPSPLGARLGGVWWSACSPLAFLLFVWSTAKSGAVRCGAVQSSCQVLKSFRRGLEGEKPARRQEENFQR